MADILKVTQVGLDASTDAAHSQIAVKLTTFKVGSAYAYNPTKLDTSLHGTVLYTDNITSFSTDSQGNLIINCTIAAAAGPFLFGELGIYTDAGVLFALMALPDLQHKYSALGSNVASTFTFSCYLRMGQAGGVIDIVTGGGGTGSTFEYVMQSGQPAGVWGSNDGGISYVWNPLNFNVATSVSSKGVVSTAAVTYSGTSHTWTNVGGTTLATLDASGNFTTSGNTGGYSDIRLKKEIKPLTRALDKIRGLSGVTFSMISVEGEDRRYTGLIAQHVQAVLPEATNADDQGMLSVFYANLAGLWAEGFKELEAIVLDQGEQIKRLKAHVRTINARY